MTIHGRSKEEGGREEESKERERDRPRQNIDSAAEDEERSRRGKRHT